MNPDNQQPTYKLSDAEIAEIRTLIRKFQESGLISKRPGIADEYIASVQRPLKEKANESLQPETNR